MTAMPPLDQGQLAQLRAALEARLAALSGVTETQAPGSARDLPVSEIETSPADKATGAVPVRPNTTKLRPALFPEGASVPLEPTTRSARPSPLKSPAEDTVMPLNSVTSGPWMTKPPEPAATAERSMAVKPALRPKTT